MPQKYYQGIKHDPLTEEEVKQKYKDIQEEILEVMAWKKETEANLNNEKISPQKRGAAKRAMKKIKRRIDTVQGQIIYWKLRVAGESHFKASIEKNEYWAKCNEEAEAEKHKIEEAELPKLLKNKK
ncbi:hypothetical protein HN832_03440 [archaeon]|jgi:hypothetical protein|nr:hypothetical protein [archaeon]MBT4373550.1 hypothetical protein [archaeon]MBT4531998.1 hypothetical protein [archaeon]MBT7001665.1 hypothetical protein [archaeon]MBT7282443.1 hypothetical protein [archaeon]